MTFKSMVTLAATAVTLTTSAQAQNRTVQLKGILVVEHERTKRPVRLTRRGAYIERVAGKKVFYRKDNPKSVNIEQVKLRDLLGIYLERPKEYIAGVEFYENRQYQLALAEFQTVKEKYSKMSDYDNSFPALSGLYELDCYRKLKQYNKLAKAEKIFAKEKYLKKPSHMQQVKIYKLWGSLVDKEYSKIIKVYEADWKFAKVTGSLRAQLEYIYGRALEEQGRPTEALIALSKATIADFANSEVLSREAIDASFRIINADKEVTDIKNMWDKGNNNKLLKLKINTMPYFRLIEAGALVRVHDKLALSGYDKDGKMIPLDPSYKKFLKYTRKAGNKILAEN